MGFYRNSTAAKLINSIIRFMLFWIFFSGTCNLETFTRSIYAEGITDFGDWGNHGASAETVQRMDRIYGNGVFPLNQADEMSEPEFQIPKVTYAKAFLEAGRLMVPMGDICSFLGIEEPECLWIDGMTLSGKPLTKRNYNGIDYIWIRALAERFNFSISWDKDGIVNLARNGDIFKVITFVVSYPDTIGNVAKQAPIIIKQITSENTVNRKSGSIALTFDDGPNPSITPAIVDILHRYNSRATFFLVGNIAKRYPSLCRLLVEEGHEIGNHTLTHAKLTKLEKKELSLEVVGGKSLLEAISGTEVNLLRPPYGSYSDSVVDAAKESNQIIALWSLDPKDWQIRDVERIVNQVTLNIKSGDVVVLHERTDTVAALPLICQGLQSKGFNLVTMSELINNQVN